MTGGAGRPAATAAIVVRELAVAGRATLERETEPRAAARRAAVASVGSSVWAR